MELRQLESFREVVRSGSFTAAAKTLHMTQPAVSLHMKSLEAEFGTRLLERDSRGVRLTDTGRLLLEAVERVFATLGETRRRIAEIEAPDRGTVVLACGDTVALHLLPPVLASFRKAYPLAEVQIINRGSRAVLETLLRRQADLGIVTRPPHLDPRLQARTIREEPLWLALPKKHRLASGGPLEDASELAGEPAVLLEAGTETRSVIDRALRSAGVQLQVVMESGNLEVVKTYVKAGLGLSIIPDLALTAQDHRRLVLRRLPPDFPERRLALVRLKERKPTELLGALLGLVAEHLRED